jgi:hypothetical protein
VMQQNHKAIEKDSWGTHHLCVSFFRDDKIVSKFEQSIKTKTLCVFFLEMTRLLVSSNKASRPRRRVFLFFLEMTRLLVSSNNVLKSDS